MTYDHTGFSTNVLQFAVYVIDPGDSVGYEMSKRRPYMVVSPTNINSRLGTVIVAPMTSTKKLYISRVPCLFQGKQSYIALDQIMRVDKSRLLTWIGQIDTLTGKLVVKRLALMLGDGD